MPWIVVAPTAHLVSGELVTEGGSSRLEGPPKATALIHAGLTDAHRCLAARGLGFQVAVQG